jgi:hypothetical protein
VFDFEQIERVLSEKPTLKDEIDRLVSAILTDKKFVFTQ